MELGSTNDLVDFKALNVQMTFNAFLFMGTCPLKICGVYALAKFIILGICKIVNIGLLDKVCMVQ